MMEQIVARNTNSGKQIRYYNEWEKDMNAGFKCKINANITVSLKRCGVTSKSTSPSSLSSPDAWMGMEVTNVSSSGQYLRVSFNKDGSLTLQSPSEKVLSFERFVSSRVSSLGNRVIFSNLSSSCSNLLTTTTSMSQQ